MSSKKVPLWLEFENGEAGCPNFLALFKEGDDLRQDLLTLQLLTSLLTTSSLGMEEPQEPTKSNLLQTSSVLLLVTAWLLRVAS